MKLRKVPPGAQPDSLYPPYASTVQRAPRERLVPLPAAATEASGPRFSDAVLYPHHADLTKQVEGGEPLGERIIVTGRVLDENGDALAGTLVELWQCNAAGRYHHPVDEHDAPLDPHFRGAGRALTDADGRYRFVTIKPGAYPWRNHTNAWRPAHIHFSLFGQAFLTRMVTQMYFPGDPLLPYDPMFTCIENEAARNRLVSVFDWESTIPEQALGYRFDIVLRGREETPMEKLP
jgi:protocatechuate 3,4-dioxygenase beta subunit